MNSAVTRLQSEFSARKRRNPEFSIRAFARWLGISPAQLSQILSGKRPLTTKMAAKISDKLGFSPREKVNFISSSSNEISKAIASGTPAFSELDEERFRVICDWYHLAILSLTLLPEATDDPRWISRQLGINVQDANEALRRLRSLGILTPAPSFKQVGDPIRVLGRFPSQAIRKYHAQNLALAADRLEAIPMEKREYHSITMAIRSDRIEGFRKKLDAFLTEADDELTAKNPDAVYTLSVQLFPLNPNPQNPTKTPQ
jgi:uncharacterized protein (TIGR02147 family)